MPSRSRTEHPPADGHLEQEIRLALKLDNDVPDQRIKVQVHNGVATLDGNVDAEVQKAAAEADAKRVHGVIEVVNRIHVAAPISGW